LVVQYAASLADLTLVNINPTFRREDLKFTLREMECEAFITHPAMVGVDFVQMIKEICPELDGSRIGHLKSKEVPKLKYVIRTDDAPTPGLLNFKQLYGQPLAPSDYQLDVHSTAIITLTSGTTGNPKGVPSSHFQQANSYDCIHFSFNLTSETRYCSHIPFIHATTTAICLGVITAGGTLVFPDQTYSPPTTLDAVEREKITEMTGTPPLYYSLIAEQKARPRNLKSWATAALVGDMHTPDLIKAIESVLNVKKVGIGYGATEGVMSITASPYPDANEIAYDSCGTVVPNLEIKLTNERGEIVPVGEVGEVCIKGPQVFKGYWKDPQATQAVFDADGFFHTSDFGLFDEKMYLHLKGRKRDIVLSRRGFHIFMSEVESFLNTHPDIAQAVAFGLPDNSGAENVYAWIKMKPGKTPITLEAIQIYGRLLVAEYKIPDFIRLVESFPLNNVGKIAKPAIKQQEIAFRTHK
jgi:fatty-acyl-CoA synthase